MMMKTDSHHCTSCFCDHLGLRLKWFLLSKMEIYVQSIIIFVNHKIVYVKCKNFKTFIISVHSSVSCSKKPLGTDYGANVDSVLKEVLSVSFILNRNITENLS